MKKSKVKSIKPVRGWAVWNTSLNMVCLTGTYVKGGSLGNSGSAFFEKRTEAVAYKKALLDGEKWNEIKIIPTLISPLKARKERKK